MNFHLFQLWIYLWLSGWIMLLLNKCLSRKVMIWEGKIFFGNAPYIKSDIHNEEDNLIQLKKVWGIRHVFNLWKSFAFLLKVVTSHVISKISFEPNGPCLRTFEAQIYVPLSEGELNHLIYFPLKHFSHWIAVKESRYSRDNTYEK